MKLSEEESVSVQVAASTTGSLSAIATCAMLLMPAVATGPEGSLHFWIVWLLAFFNLVEAVMFAVGRAAIHDNSDTVSGACKVQGGIMQFCSIASFLWILFFCVLLVQSFVRRQMLR